MGLYLFYREKELGLGTMIHGKMKTSEIDEIYTEIQWTVYRFKEYLQWETGWIRFFQPNIDDGASFNIGGMLMHSSGEGLKPDLITGLNLLEIEDNLLFSCSIQATLMEFFSLYVSPRLFEPHLPVTLELGLGYQSDFGGVLGNMNFNFWGTYFTIQGFVTP